MLSPRFTLRLTWLLKQYLLLSFFVVGAARDAPQNLRDLYDAIRAKRQCSNELATGFYSKSSGSNTFSYCGDRLQSSGIIYLQGRNGALANMDVDCDGAGGVAEDGRCRYELSPDTQNVTSFRDAVMGYGKGLKDLNPYVHPYVVFGNDKGTRHTAGWHPFDPTEKGMKPLSVMAVVCSGYQVVYGIWGDTNGDDGAKPMIGEASLALATACGGKGMNGDSGIDEDSILFVGFTGDEAVPGANGANWTATDFDSFEKSIEGLGTQLVGRIQADKTDKAGASGSGRIEPEWVHVAGAAVFVLVLGITLL